MKAKTLISLVARRANLLLTATILLAVVALAATGHTAPAASASDLLEKGIYAEETRGDLDAAMKLYEQAASEAQAGQAVGAQAQYRLGVCHYKKKNYAEAAAAFEKLLRDFPDQKELVSRAREYLAGTMTLQPAPWTDGEQLRLDIKFPTGYKLGVAFYSASAGTVAGRKTWHFSTQIYAGVRQYSAVDVEAENCRPIRSFWGHTLLGEAEANYTAQQAEVKLKAKPKVEKAELAGLVYDNEEFVQLARRLPLAEKYCANVQILTSLGGGRVIPLGVTVPAIEKVTVPAGTFECFRVELSLKQTFWYSTDAHRYLVKFEAGGIAAELAEIAHVKPGEAAQWQDPDLSLTAPSGWIAFRPENKDRKPSDLRLLFEPEDRASAKVELTPLAKVKEAVRNSPRARAEEWLANTGEDAAAEPRAATWQECTVAGQPGASVVADLADETNKVAYLVFGAGKTNAIRFSFKTATDELESWRPKFDAIVGSAKVN